jgi:hypothetical protein
MDSFNVITKIVVPLVSPLIAACALIVAFLNEARKLRLQRTYDRETWMSSLFTDSLYVLDLFELVVDHQRTGTVTQVHIDELAKSFDRLFERIMADPETGRAFYDCVRFREKGKRKNMFTLLAEARFRVSGANANKRMDPVVHFALLTICYLYETDRSRRDERYSAMTEYEKHDPSLYGPLMVARDTPSLRVAGRTNCEG